MVPLGPQARAVLADLLREDGNPWDIAGRLKGSHITDLQKPWRHIRARWAGGRANSRPSRLAYLERAGPGRKPDHDREAARPHAGADDRAVCALARNSIQNAAARITGSIGGTVDSSGQRVSRDAMESNRCFHYPVSHQPLESRNRSRDSVCKFGFSEYLGPSSLEMNFA